MQIAKHHKIVNSLLKIKHWEHLYEQGLKELQLPQARRGINLRSVLDSLLLENKFRLIKWLCQQHQHEFPVKTAKQISNKMGIEFEQKAHGEATLSKAQWNQLKDEMYRTLSNGHHRYKKAQSLMFNRYKRLVHSMVNRQVFDRNKRADAFQEASLGLLHAIDKVQDSHASFNSYARSWISRHIKNFLMGEHFPVHVPINLASKILCKHNQNETQKNELHENLLKPSVSLDEVRDSEEDGQTQQLTDIDGVIPSENLGQRDLHSTVKYYMTELSDKQQKVLQLRYGLNKDSGSTTLASIANRVGISHQQVSMREKRALQKLETILRPIYKEIYACQLS